jgi:hypothetical protein
MGTNEQGVEIGEARNRYTIQTEQDIVRYLTASLFSEKDLAYVLTENSIHNQKIIENTPVNNPAANNTDIIPPTTLNIKTDYASVTNGVYTLQAITDRIAIHDIFN